MKDTSTFLVLCFFLVGILSAQNNKPEFNPRKTKGLPFYVLTEKDSSVGLNQILEEKRQFIPSVSIKETSKPGHTYWLKIDFKNDLDTLESSEAWRLRASTFDNAEIYFIDNGKLSRKAIGRFDFPKKRSSTVHWEGFKFGKQNLIENRYLYIKLRFFNYYASIQNWKVGYLSENTNLFYTDYYSKSDLKKLLKEYLYLGACSITCLFFLAVFVYTQRFEFLFYALYVFSSIVYLTLPSMELYWIKVFYYTIAGYWTVVISQIFINLFYVVFAMFYLDTRNTYPNLHKLMLSVSYILMALIAMDALLYFTGYYDIHLKLLDFQRLLMTSFGLFSMIYMLCKKKDNLVIFIVVGSFIFMIGALAFLFTVNRFYMITGSILEIIIFSLGLAYKIKIEYEEKLMLQNKVSLNEISALRAQMNPHFIFNSLNSIQHFILSNDRLSAIRYLSKFSKLTRNVLENSIDHKVPLNDEIKLLSSYLELESLRFNEMFHYQIEVSEDLDTDNTDIPLLLIQPYVENAIVHGLSKQEEGTPRLNISFKKEGEDIVCEIEDNGIGRVASQKASSAIKRLRKSRGMEITGKRLKLLNQSQIGKNTIEVIDKYDEKGIPSGTKVTIRIRETLKVSA